MAVRQYKKSEVAGTTGVVRTTSGRGAIGIIAEVIYSASEMRPSRKKVRLTSRIHSGS
jgi:hypothetical protein